jgi:multimeric flavodoxin WrbA
MNKILVLKSSPRLNGNSAALAEQTAAGARDAGAQVNVFSLHDMDIQPCDACDSCRETDGICVIGDDMQVLYPKLEEADAVILASPIYWFTINAQMKAFIDRWYALVKSDGHELAGKKFGIILTYGDSDPYNSGAVNAIHTYESMFRYIKAEIAGLVYGSADAVGDVEKNSELMEKAYKLGKKLGSG